MNLATLFIDAEALVIDKPAGLDVTPPRKGGPSLDDHLRALAFGFRRAPAIAHRLDRDTSGCLLLARHPKALKRFQQAFEMGSVRKTYLAVIEGSLPGESGRIDLPLAKTSSAASGWRMIASPEGKAALTDWRVLDRRGNQALLCLTPQTGRTHQLRVHLATGLGCPILGDPVYGRGEGPMMLHARSLMLPRAGKNPIEAVAPLPDHMLRAGWSVPDGD